MSSGWCAAAAVGGCGWMAVDRAPTSFGYLLTSELRPAPSTSSSSATAHCTRFEFFVGWTRVFAVYDLHAHARAGVSYSLGGVCRVLPSG